MKNFFKVTMTVETNEELDEARLEVAIQQAIENSKFMKAVDVNAREA